MSAQPVIGQVRLAPIFEAARPLANRRFTQRPALIARAQGAEDGAVAVAREHGAEVRAAYRASYDRLAAIKAQYDPATTRIFARPNDVREEETL